MKEFMKISVLGIVLIGASISAAAIPEAPYVKPRFHKVEQFSEKEKREAEQAWELATKYIFYGKWVMESLERKRTTKRKDIWNLRSSAPFAGLNSKSDPRNLFGKYSHSRFNNVLDGYQKIWEKISSSSWKMKRQNCIASASAHVIVYPQIRLCNRFFGRTTEDAARLLVHEFSHHIWLRNPLRQIKDRHVAPRPDCSGDANACYGLPDAEYLAEFHPKHAVANPDNFAYFARFYFSQIKFDL